ncbi:unnamed protein product [Lymnaea stagnalis]|uniref:MAM domain-containing protein n=1 Tax=Lymnaea stagnalis TaxID=6523 RepID=A0AAV2HQ36_LYMST
MCSLVPETSPTYRLAYGKSATAAGPYAGNTNGADSFLVIHEVPGHTGVVRFHTASFHNGPVCIEFYLFQKGPSSYIELIYQGPTLATAVFKSYHNSNHVTWYHSKTYLNVPAGVQFSITFQAHMASGDVAIDDLYIYNGHCL